MLGVGIDWAEEFHVVALGRPAGAGVVEVIRVEHRPGAVEALVARIAGLEPDPADVRVVLETRHGLLVERLVEAGYLVLPVNPEMIAKRRGPAWKKDDAEDARLACLWRWTRTRVCGRWSRIRWWPGSFARSRVMTSVPAATNVACSTGSARTC
jgi:hypothetical protein